MAGLLNANAKRTPASGAVGTPTGWAAVAKAIRELDEEKVRDCKEDIDTLLVFAGLFSAVLTAFLVVSYTNLQPDTGLSQVALLEAISSQTRSYTLSTGFMNATFPGPPSPPPFEPVLEYIYINAFWFTSLILSLVTASLGMLVKQWLRGYLAGEYSSPQMRLRVRQFRLPGLSQWKVYQTSAVLPMMLQFALGLFLFGLCIFVLSVDVPIGLTLSCIFGLYFMFYTFTLVAPVFYPRCPYKTNLFAHIIKRLRIAVHQGRRGLLLRLNPLVKKAEQAGWKMPKSFSGSIATALDRPLFYDEEDAMKDVSRDAQILMELDETLMDDDLLMAMWDAYEQVEDDPQKFLGFLLGVLKRRLPINTDASSITYTRIMDLRRFPKPAFELAIHVAATVMEKAMGSYVSRDWDETVKHAFGVLLARSSITLPTRALEILSRCINAPYKSCACAQIINLCNATDDLDTFHHVLKRLRDSYGKLKSLEQIVRSLYYLVQQRFCSKTESPNRHKFMAEFMDEHQNIIPDNVKHATMSILLDGLLRAENNWSDAYAYEALRAVLSWPTPKSAEPEVHGRLSALLRNEVTCYLTVRQVASLDEVRLAKGCAAMTAICRAYEEAEYIARHMIAERLQEIMQSYVTSGTAPHKSADKTALNYLRLSLLITKLYAPHCTQRLQHEHIEDWRTLWKLTADALRRYKSSNFQGAEDSCKQIALAALKQLDSLLGTVKKSITKGVATAIDIAKVATEKVEIQEVETEEEQYNRFPDDLFVALAAFVPSTEDLSAMQYVSKRLASGPSSE